MALAFESDEAQEESADGADDELVREEPEVEGLSTKEEPPDTCSNSMRNAWTAPVCAAAMRAVLPSLSHIVKGSSPLCTQTEKENVMNIDSNDCPYAYFSEQ